VAKLARKPNYSFERKERERLKAEKMAARQEKREQRKSEAGQISDNGEQPNPPTPDDINRG
jgi:hypothetical protein